MESVALQAWLGMPGSFGLAGGPSALVAGAAWSTNCGGNVLPTGDRRLICGRASSPVLASGDDGVRIPEISARTGERVSNLPDATPNTELRMRGGLRLGNRPANQSPTRSAYPVPA